MIERLPFCPDCGTVGTMLSGVHPGAGGVVRWKIFRCGHMKTEVVLEAIPAGDEPDLLSSALVAD